MKVRIDIEDNIAEEEVIIKCRELSTNVQKIQRYILDLSSAISKITLFKDDKDYYIPLSEILFFETDVNFVYAHTQGDAYRTKYRLYELEDILPRDFIRVSKSTIINAQHVFSIDKNLTSSSSVQFHNSHKQVYVSRLYYKDLRQRLVERRNYEK